MSHFTVGVITKSGTRNEVRKLLAPFDEGLDVKTITSKEEIVEKAKQWIVDYMESPTYKEFTKDPVEYAKDKGKAHMDFLMSEFPKMRKMTDDELHQRETEHLDPEDMLPDGSVISYYNPNSKWDWWVIGGRWEGLIHTKSGKSVNKAKISDIDFGATPDEIEYYTDRWNVIVNDAPMTKHELAYPGTKESLIETYGTMENYIKEMAKFSTFATLLPSGEWIEPGQMGWFGTSTATDESRQEHQKYIESIYDEYKDHYLTVVDCHI